MRRLLAVVTLLTLSGCGPRIETASDGVIRLALPATAVETEARPRKVARGQLLYLPCYSHVYLLDGKPYNLAITLSLRNTSQKGKLVIQSVAYYDSNGTLIKELAPKEIEMGPMSTAEVLVHEESKAGGSGASFLIRWVAESEISDPVVEAAMVGSSGSLGVSFLTRARALETTPPAPGSAVE